MHTLHDLVFDRNGNEVIKLTKPHFIHIIITVWHFIMMSSVLIYSEQIHPSKTIFYINNNYGCCRIVWRTVTLLYIFLYCSYFTPILA